MFLRSKRPPSATSATSSAWSGPSGPFGSSGSAAPSASAGSCTPSASSGPSASSVLAAAPLAAALALFSPPLEAQSIVPGDPGAAPAPKAVTYSSQDGGGRAGVDARHASPIGLWQTIDDQTGKPRSLVRILDGGDGILVGRIEKILDPRIDHPDPVCERCDDDRKDQPIIGLEIIRGLKPHGGHWAGGRILNPEDGRIYHLKATPVDAGTKLEMRGYIGLPMFGRTQIWIREP